MDEAVNTYEGRKQILNKLREQIKNHPDRVQIEQRIERAMQINEEEHTK